MRYLKYTFAAFALVFAGIYGWYLLATEVNRHADFAATAIIEDSLSTNAAYDIKQLRQLESALRENNVDSAINLVQKLIDTKVHQLETCVSEQCKILKERRGGQ